MYRTYFMLFLSRVDEEFFKFLLIKVHFEAHLLLFTLSCVNVCCWCKMSKCLKTTIDSYEYFIHVFYSGNFFFRKFFFFVNFRLRKFYFKGNFFFLKILVREFFFWLKYFLLNKIFEAHFFKWKIFFRKNFYLEQIFVWEIFFC